jgi:hypothetical protein
MGSHALRSTHSVFSHGGRLHSVESDHFGRATKGVPKSYLRREDGVEVVILNRGMEAIREGLTKLENEDATRPREGSV